VTDLLSDIVKRGSYRSCEHEKSARAYELFAATAAADRHPIRANRESKKAIAAAQMCQWSLNRSAVGSILRSKLVFLSCKSHASEMTMTKTNECSSHAEWEWA
jgi:hypothetical protein